MKKITFEEKKDVIDCEIQKRKSKWFLSSVIHIDFDDVSQILRTHIYKKWNLWDQSKPLEPWLNRVISNQIKNLIRNNYGTFAKPCINCPFNQTSCGETNLCNFTSSGTQSSECPLYAKWEKRKKHEFNIKIPSSFDSHDFEIQEKYSDNVDLERSIERMHHLMSKKLNKKQFFAYKLLFIENLNDLEVAKMLGYKTSEKNRVAGYRQIKNLKNAFQKMAKQILKEEDIFYG